MASQAQIRDFLAHWFQLGKPVVLAENRGECLPDPIFHNGQYSQAFEDCWHKIMVTSGRDCYLQGTAQSIAEMLSPVWEITPCARCEMPVAVPTAGIMTSLCPCDDLPTWPNTEIPMPRTGIDSQEQLTALRHRLSTVNGSSNSEPKASQKPLTSPPQTEEDASTLSSWRGMS